MAKIILICSNKSIVKDVTEVAHHKGCEFEHYTEQEWRWKNNSNNVISMQSKLILDPSDNKSKTLKDIQIKAIQKAILEANGNISKAARVLYIGRATLYRKIKKYEIDIENIRTDNNQKTATAA